MLRIIKKIDVMVIIIFFTISVGVLVITMRSNTYSIGYEIAALKSSEKILRQKQTELQTELATTQRMIRDKLLAEKNIDGKLKYTLPDQKHVLREK